MLTGGSSRSAGTVDANLSRSAIDGASRSRGGATRSRAITPRSSGSSWLALIYQDRIAGTWHLERLYD
jgi:hypothetical protein